MTTAAARLPLPTFELDDALQQFTNHLQARVEAYNTMSTETLASYTTSVRQAVAFWRSVGAPQDVAYISREHVEMFYADLRARAKSSATVVNRDKGLRAFFKWLVDEGELRTSPLARMSRPALEPTIPRACNSVEVQAMIDACPGTTFLGRRRAALLAFMVDTGWRCSEVASVTVQMVTGEAPLEVRGKGQKVVRASLRPSAQRYVDSYLRSRRTRPGAHWPALWLTSTGKPMTRHDIWSEISTAGKVVGLDIHPHTLRHTHAMWWLEDGGSLPDLQQNLAHADIKTTQVYLRYMATERAMKARLQFGPGNRLR